MVVDQTTKKDGSSTRKLLPFWAKELLAMKDEAERKHAVELD
jgi:hypothetical protein